VILGSLLYRDKRAEENVGRVVRAPEHRHLAAKAHAH